MARSMTDREGRAGRAREKTGSRNCNSQQRREWGVAAGRGTLNETLKLILSNPSLYQGENLSSDVSGSQWA